MGIINVIKESVKETIINQYKEVLMPQAFDEHSLVVPGVLKNTKNNKSTPGIVSSGSIIYVPENTAAFIMDKNGIEYVITQPGGYKYENGESSIFNKIEVDELLKNAISRIGFGGESSEQKEIVYINLREIRDIKFGTKGPQVYNDLFYGTDLEITSFGTFSIKINDPKKFVQNFLPANVNKYSIDDDGVRTQLLSEFMQSYIVAVNSLSDKFRISQLPSQANQIANEIINDKVNAGSWSDRFGFAVIKVSIENIEFSEASKELVRQYSENKMNLKAYEDISQKASNISAQQKIAEGIKENGLGEGGNMLFGMNMAQALNGNAQQSDINDYDKKIESIKKLKELLDSGAITDEEYQKMKTQIMS